MHNLEFYLYGNVVLNFTQFNRKDLKKLKRIGVAGLIVPLNPITGIANEENTSEFIASLTKN
jgi:hypothetical protein